MFLDIFHIYIPFIFCKKNTEHLCHYFSFYRIFRKATNFGEIFKKITFSEKITTKMPKFHDFNKKFIRIAFVHIKHCKQNKKYQKSFNLILKLVKIINFLIKKIRIQIWKISKVMIFARKLIKLWARQTCQNKKFTL